MSDTEVQEWDDQTVYGPSTVIAVLDRIEDLIEDARVVPLSALVMVNKAEILDLLDQAREALPEDLVAADAVVADADAVLGRADSAAETTIAEANARAQSTLEEARTKAEQLVNDASEQSHTLLTHTEEEAHDLLDKAHEEAQRIREEAQAQAERMMSQENITQMAHDRAHQIVAEARRTDAQLRSGADEYAAQCLTELSALLKDLQRRTDAGRRTIAERTGVDRTDIDVKHD
ncbi:hypothetical protein [Schaalia sp. lx-260]|uniref:hypothetical protein n=1 Tax=Schaalia sp. lx-260 TaxID=2899082 RepID=UPI001E4F528A|nr:hypothetical protein [Schaalia sp. lx-260]MCD4549869.1 hypothetical protein [Schaalia sp. lx-260]